jgi:hypothetical protein
MTTSIIYGFGFNVDEISDERLIAFMIKHKDTFCKSDTENELFCEVVNLTDLDIDVYGIEDFFEEYACDVSGHEGKGSVISNVISRETGIRMEYQMAQSDCDGYPSVLLVEAYPWNYNEKERNLTIDSLTELLLPYAKELGLRERDIDGLEVEYYG